jgi:hypothetical protein
MAPSSRAAAPLRAAGMLAAALLAGTTTAQETSPTDSRPASRPDTRASADAVEGATVGGTAPYKIRGSTSVSYRGRTTDDGNDDDLYGYLSLDGGTANVDEVGFHLLARATFDLDSGPAVDGGPFGSLNDVGRDDLDVKLYEAYVDLTGSLAPESLGLKRVRLGRQNVHAAFSYLVDGARLEFAPVKSAGDLRIGVFGGVPEYLYEASRSGDWIVGGDAAFRPFDDTRVDLRYVHVEDDNAWVGGSATDDFASLSVRQRLSDQWRASATWNTVDGHTRDVSGRIEWQEPDLDLTVKGSYKYQSNVTQEYTTVYDPYVGVLGVSYAHNQYQLEATKLFGEHFGADAGFAARFLRDRSLDGPFNREWTRGWLTLSSYRWPADTLDLSLTGEIWDSDGDADTTTSVGAEATFRPNDEFRFGAGTYYSLFKHDLFVVDERQDVTTFFLKARWNCTTSLRLDARYEFETGDEGDFHTGTVGLTLTF